MDASMKFFVRTCVEDVRCTWSYRRAWGQRRPFCAAGDGETEEMLRICSSTRQRPRPSPLASTSSLRLGSCFIFGVQCRLAHTLIYSTLFSRRRLRTSNPRSPNVASPTCRRGRRTLHPCANLLYDPARLQAMPLNALLESDRVPDRPRPMRPIIS